MRDGGGIGREATDDPRTGKGVLEGKDRLMEQEKCKRVKGI